MSINPEQFQSAIKKMLDEYGDEATDAMKDILPDVAKDGVKMIKQLSPSGYRKTDKYKQTWTHTQIAGRLYAKEYIHQKAGKKFQNWRLVHLLVKGHMSRNGGWVEPAKEHVQPTQDFVEREFLQKLKQRLER